MMGGELSVESESGKGAVFTFSLRLGLSSASPSNPLMVPQSMIGLKALVVDEGEVSREILVDLLSDLSFEVEGVGKSDKAFKILEDRPDHYDLIVIDSKDSGANADRDSRTIRQMKLCKSPRILVVTASCRQVPMDGAGGQDIDGVLMKPVIRSVLFDTLLNCFGVEQPFFETKGRKQQSLPPGVDGIRGARVLLVEDNEINQQLAVELLESENLSVTVAGNGAEACDRVLNCGESYDIVLMDLQMPVMDGYEATRIIRQKVVSDTLPIVAMSADAMEGVKEKVLGAGMDGYIMKPVDVYRMFQVLVDCLKTVPSDRATNVPGKKTSSVGQFSMPTIDGLDMAEGVKRVAGNTSVYRKILRGFAEKNRDMACQIRGMLEKGEKATVERMVHTLKGGSGSIGAKGLYTETIALEKAVQTDDAQGVESCLEFIESHLAGLVEQIQGAFPLDGPAPISACETRPLDVEQFRRKLSALKEALTDGSAESEKRCEDLLRVPGAISVVEDPGQLRGLISNYAYDEAVDLVSSLQKSIAAERKDEGGQCNGS